MPRVTITHTVEQVRPLTATPAQAVKLRAAGMSVVEIARAWGISRARVYQLLDRDRKRQAKRQRQEVAPGQPHG